MYALGTHEADAKMGEHHLPTEKKKGVGYRMSSQVTVGVSALASCKILGKQCLAGRVGLRVG